MFRDMGLMVLGERSGGGACTILGLNTADGFYYHISDYQMRLTNDNWEVIDAGVSSLTLSWSRPTPTVIRIIRISTILRCCQIS